MTNPPHDAVHRQIIQTDLFDMVKSNLPWERLSGARVLVTGATGLVGAYMVETLAFHHRVTGQEPTSLLVVARDVDKALQRFAHIPSAQLEVVEHDLGSELHVRGPVDFVVHGASPATPTSFARHPIGSYLPNVVGTHHLLALAAAKASKGFVFLSSGAAHGDVTGHHAFDETTLGVIDPLDPYSVYSESKRMGETICVAWWRQHAVPTTMVRLGHTYGPGLRSDDSRAFAQFLHCSLEGRDIELHSAGTERRDFCYLSDAVAGILMCLLLGEPGTPYLLMNAEGSLTIRELAELLARLSPVGGVRVRMDAAVPDTYIATPWSYSRPDTTRIRALGWAPRVTPEEGFRRTIRAHAPAGPRD